LGDLILTFVDYDVIQSHGGFTTSQTAAKSGKFIRFKRLKIHMQHT
jgi:hypothetical protein